MADFLDKEKAALGQFRSAEPSIRLDQFIGLVLADRYQIVELIGSGGWGNVYRASHLTLNKDLAIKIVHRHLLKDELNLKRFDQEALLLSKIESTYVVRIIDYGFEPAPFIVMEYFPGIPLSEWLKNNGRMPAQMAIEMFIQLCNALYTAESLRIVHRDLKPSNILLKSNCDEVQCKILDFGLAKLLDPEAPGEKITSTGEILGSPAYMSPEQWNGQCDHRSDIYSLGCIMYEVLTGHPPFSAQSGVEYMARHLSDMPAQISQPGARSSYQAGLEVVVTKCMQKSPANRYQSSLACREDLIKLKAGQKPSITLLERFNRHKKRNVIASCILLSSVLAACIWDLSGVREYEDSGVRGKYFEKKSYSGSAIPRFEDYKDKLPIPILEDEPQYVELYWKAWQLAFQHLKAPAAGSPLVSNYIEQGNGGDFGTFQWDIIFMMMFGRYAHHVFPFNESLDNFYARQYENGYIFFEIDDSNGAGADMVISERQNSVNPPLFSWAEREYARISGDQSRFAKVLPALQKYAEWLEKYRRKSGTAHKLFWNTPIGSGMWHSPRHGSGWVDMSAQMVLMYEDMADMAERLNMKQPAKTYRSRASEIASSINRFMWNERDGLYYDIDDQGKQIPCKTVACFWPLIAGICDKQQVSKLMLNLKDPKAFWRHDVFPSLAADQRGYRPDACTWEGGVWASTNVMIIKGLDRYPSVEGEGEFAVKAVRRYLDNMCAVYKATGTIWQSYSAESDAPGTAAKRDMVGWSGLGPIELLIEDVLGIQADGLEKTISWRLARIDRHGIENLRFGEITASLVASRRDNLNSPAEILVTTDKPFELRVCTHTTRVFQVPAGKHIYRVD
jgi:serine/threonine protein kinase